MDAPQEIGECRDACAGRSRTSKCREAWTDLRCFSAIDCDGASVLVAIVIDGLSEQRNFNDATVDEPFAFVNDVIWWTVNLSPSSIGNNAIGAEFVTSARDSHIGAVPLDSERGGIECA